MGISFPGVFSHSVWHYFLGGKLTVIYMIPGELRAHLASAVDFGLASSALLETIILSTPPTPPRRAGQMTRATTDAVNPRAALLLRDPTRWNAHSSFVEDTGIAQTRDCMLGAITNSILSAYAVFGFPSEERRTPCPNPLNGPPTSLTIYVSWVTTLTPEQ